MKTVLFSLILVLISSFAFSKEKEEIAVLDPLFLGEITEITKNAVSNKLLEELSKRYQITPPRKFEEARTLAFETLEVSECTEDRCVLRIQEILQIEKIFVLQIMKEKNVAQISLTLLKLNLKEVRTEICDQCDLMLYLEKVTLLISSFHERASFSSSFEPSVSPYSEENYGFNRCVSAKVAEHRSNYSSHPSQRFLDLIKKNCADSFYRQMYGF